MFPENVASQPCAGLCILCTEPCNTLIIPKRFPEAGQRTLRNAININLILTVPFLYIRNDHSSHFFFRRNQIQLSNYKSDGL